jgi:hypothetical protein
MLRKNVVFVAALTIALAACSSSSGYHAVKAAPTVNETGKSAGSEVVYTFDEQTELCFATTRVAAGKLSMTTVPCSPEVLAQTKRNNKH